MVGLKLSVCGKGGWLVGWGVLRAQTQGGGREGGGAVFGNEIFGGGLEEKENKQQTG